MCRRLTLVKTTTTVSALTWIVLACSRASVASAYDPLQADVATVDPPIDLTVVDAARDRDIPIRIYLPVGDRQASTPAPVVLFSHGLGGSRANNRYLGTHWAARGYVAVFLQHIGSDESVWKGVRPLQIMSAMRDAASRENFDLRIHDVPAVLDQLAHWNSASNKSEDDTSRLVGLMDLEHVGMSGHSFGAVTTQAVAGQSYLRGRVDYTDSRIKAAVLMSPSSPRLGTPEKAFDQVALPWLLLTGTHDVGRIGGQTPESRRQVFPALPAGDKYQLVLEGAEHSAFSERALAGDRKRRNPNHHRAVLAITTAFWDAYLCGDAAAMTWLQSGNVRSVLEDADVWEKK